MLIQTVLLLLDIVMLKVVIQAKEILNAAPLFADTSFRLSDLSPCIGAGIEAISIGGTMYLCPTTCFYGSPRPNPAGTKPDIGACESPLGLPVPVELTALTVSAIGNEVTLNWSTATELNNQGFEIQRKAFASEFATVGFIKGQGTTTQQNQYSFTDKNLDEGKYFYRLKQMDFNGSFEYSNAIEVDVRSVDQFSLEQNYPNPFNPATTIGYVLQEKGNVKLTLLNSLGEEIAILVNEEQDKGYHKVEFNGSGLASGMYLCRIQIIPANGTGQAFIETKKMLLLK